MMRLVFGLCWLLYFSHMPSAELGPIQQLNEITSANENEGPLVNTSFVHFYDEHLMEDIERHLKVISLGQENQRLGYELLSKKVEEIQKQLNELITKKYSLENEKSKILKSCDEALKNATAKDGIYRIYLPDHPEIEPFYVFCMRDPTTNEAWTIIQRRVSDQISFYREWKDYKIGFGHLLGDYWLGLDKMHALTNSKLHKLWIELRDFENVSHNANYDKFAIGNEDSQYTLSILGEFSGNAGDSLSYHVGQKFTTKDHDNDFLPDGNCARRRKGAWWFNDCSESDLNGEYLQGALHCFHFSDLNGEYLHKALDSDDEPKGIFWSSWHGELYSFKYVHMAIRPAE